jgi:hypothetical protein
MGDHIGSVKEFIVASIDSKSNEEGCQLMKGGNLVRNKLGKAIVSGLALALAICVAASANATIYYASSSATPCGTPNYPTIQDAVNHAVAGSTVEICAGQGSNPDGSYPEQIFINKRLTVEGVAVGNTNQAVITAPIGGVITNANSLIDGSAIQAQIYVTDTSPVNITNVVVAVPATALPPARRSWSASTIRMRRAW